MEAENSLEEDLKAAWNDAEEAPEAPPEPEPVIEEPEPSSDEPIPEAVAPESVEEAPGTEPGHEPEPEPAADTPPKGLSPAAREAWKDTPEPVRAELAKREADYSAGIQQYAENSKRAEQMDRTLAPYQQLFAMNGGRPAETINNVLQTASVLQMGSPQQKAGMVANMIKQFGVDIQQLDSILVGQPQQPQQPQGQQQLTPEAVQQMIQQGFQQQHSQQTAASVNNSLQTFAADPANEFYHDVKADMADLMDVAASRRQEMSLKQAYDKACMMRDDIRQVITNRQAQAQVDQRAQAAVSVGGAPSGPGAATPQTDDIHSALLQAWDDVGNG